MTLSSPDILVVGAGHNTLTAAAYLARCGLSVLVLERNAQAGGGAISRQVTRPNYIHDIHATNVNLLQRHPILAKDELGLKSRFGLKFAFPEIGYMTIFDDGSSISCYVDLDKACAEIARYSEKDALSYRKLIGLVQSMGPIIGLAMSKPPASLGSVISMLERVPGGDEFIHAMLNSGYDVISQNFEHPKVQLHFLRWGGEMSISPFQKTSGLGMLQLIGGAHSAPGGVAIGGTQALTDALIASIKADGGEIRVSSPVARIVNAGGQARTVELADGQRITAKKAVLAGIHPHLLGEMISDLNPDMVRKAKNTLVSDYAGISIHAALNQRPEWICGEEPHRCMAINLIEGAQLEEFQRGFDDLRDGTMSKHFNAYCNVHSNHDPSRAPAGGHTFYGFKWAPYALKDGGPERWDEVKEAYADEILAKMKLFAPNLGSNSILARYVESPLDHARHTPSFQQGDLVGIAMFASQMFGRRPTVELSQYRVPGADGLYLAGPFMHPGGGLAGGGRPVATRIMEDFKVDYSKVIMS